MPPPEPPVPLGRRARSLALVGTFTASVFLSAFLLFLVQPMFGKMVLPLLGGSPAVWNTCMLFFQAALLGGYLYAHVSSRMGVRAQAGVHVGLLALTALLLPISVAGRAPEGSDAPIPWLLGTMLLTVGPPFFVLAGTGPMLQRWFAHTGHEHAADPYPLYAASNLGSMLSLLAYPAWMEPRMRLAGQSAAWSLGFAALALLIAASAVWIWRPVPPPADASTEMAEGGARTDALTHSRTPLPWRERSIWVFLAFVPSAMLLALTTYITTDLSPVPLLWVLPLALYLLTFTLAFARRPPMPHEHMLWLQPPVLMVVVLLLLSGYVEEAVAAIPLHLAGLFVTAMVCHGELARRRPSVRHLTEFYLWISVGGVLGGIFNVLVAPVIFNNVYEYALSIGLACVARPWPEGGQPWKRHALLGVRAVVVTGALLYLGANAKEMNSALLLVSAGALMVLMTLALGRAPLWLALSLGTVMAYSTAKAIREPGVLLAERSFYGRFKVVKFGTVERFHVLRHGSTLHGAQSLAHPRDPITYYLPFGPVGQIFAATEDRAGRRKVAVVGLGTGTTAAYARAGEDWTFYEIDPHVVRMANDRRYFTYLPDSPARTRIELGDARLSLARDSQPRYDMILLDAFSSDAIPVHLLTREAMGTYLGRLAPRGIIAIHISNRYLDLEPVVAALVRERGLAARVSSGPTGKRKRYESIATWITVARTEDDLAIVAADSRWKPLTDRRVRPWTDDYSSLLSVFQW
jgi:spermidine synthase